MTLPEQLAALRPVGNAADDAEIFRIAHLILTGDCDMLDKLQALRRIDEAMGERGEISEHAVEEYCRQTADDFQG